MQKFLENYGGFLIAIIAVVMCIIMFTLLKSPTSDELNKTKEKMIDAATGKVLYDGQYSIKYNLKGGTLKDVNYLIYSEEDEFTLNNPTRKNATFLGWTGSNGSIPQTTVTIKKGTKGDLNFVANWDIKTVYGYQEVKEWSDEYTETTPESNFYKSYSGYDIEKYTKCSISDTQTNEGYEFQYNNKYIKCTNKEDNLKTIIKSFEGNEYYSASSNTFYKVINTPTLYALPKSWKETVITDSAGEALLSLDSNIRPVYSNDGGDTWKELEGKVYTISYNLNGGTSTNPQKYVENLKEITLVEPTKIGYEFVGWTGSNGETPQTAVTIKKEDSGNKTYTANWKIKEYSINLTTNNTAETITLSHNKASVGTEIAIGISSESWMLNSVTAKDASGNYVTITNNKFTMPASNVTVNVNYKYKKLSYIESESDAYLLTGVNASSGYKIEMSAELTGVWGEGSIIRESLFGVNGNDKEAFFRVVDKNTYAFWANTKGSSTYTNFTFKIGKKYKIEADFNSSSQTLKIDGTTIKTLTATKSYVSTQIPLFAEYKGGSYSNLSSAKMYYCKLWNSSGTLVRNYIPVERLSDNVKGMFDKVNSKFYKSATSTNFTGS